MEGDSKPLSLIIKVGTETYSVTGSVCFDGWIKDETSPAIVKAEVIGDNQLKLVFSEDVSGADDIANYDVIYGKNFAVKIDNATYDSDNNFAVLITKDKLYEGDYSVSTINIKDTSHERNSISNERFLFSSEAVKKDIGYVINRLWFVIAIVAVLIIAAIVIPITVRNKRKIEEKKKAEAANGAIRSSEYLGKLEGLSVELTVVDSNRIERKINTVIGGCYLIGRKKDMCELGIEDSQLSRQHCALSYEAGVLTIQDLKSTNGTLVNGVAITNPRAISSGDIIELGNTKIVIKFK